MLVDFYALIFVLLGYLDVAGITLLDILLDGPHRCMVRFNSLDSFGDHLTNEELAVAEFTDDTTKLLDILTGEQSGLPTAVLARAVCAELTVS